MPVQGRKEKFKKTTVSARNILWETQTLISTYFSPGAADTSDFNGGGTIN